MATTRSEIIFLMGRSKGENLCKHRKNASLLFLCQRNECAPLKLPLNYSVASGKICIPNFLETWFRSCVNVMKIYLSLS